MRSAGRPDPYLPAANVKTTSAADYMVLVSWGQHDGGGSCCQPGPQYRRAPKGTVALIDAAFEARIDIVENGASRRVSVFEEIFLQLWTKEMSGDKRAIAVRLKYQEFVSRQGGPSEIIVEQVCQESTENE
jgi:hypothetical protein